MFAALHSLIADDEHGIAVVAAIVAVCVEMKVFCKRRRSQHGQGATSVPGRCQKDLEIPTASVVRTLHRTAPTSVQLNVLDSTT